MSLKDTILNAFIAGRAGQPVGDVATLTATLLRDAGDEEQQRLKAIAARWGQYYGDGPKPLKVKTGDTDDNIRLNYAGRVVDEGASFLFGLDIDFVAGGKDTEADDSRVDDALEDMWADNQGMVLLSELAINGGVAGDAYLMLLPADEDDSGHTSPRLRLLDPATVSATWDGGNYKKVLQWVIRWTAVDPEDNKPRQYRKLITRETGAWSIADQESRDDGRSWSGIGEPVAWPYAWSPVFHTQNLPAPNQFYGVSDLEDDVLEAGNAVNFSVSNIARILRFHAHPRTWGYGIGAQDIKIGVESAMIFKSEKASLQNLEMLSDLSSSLAFSASLLKAFHAIARIPEIATGQLENLGQLSGLALKVLYGPLLKKTSVKQRLYGAMLCDLSQRMLELAGKPGARVSITWPDPLPSDPLAERQALEIDESLGVSKASILSKLGYDAKQEADRKSQETQDMGDTLLTQFDHGNTGEPK